MEQNIFVEDQIKNAFKINKKDEEKEKGLFYTKKEPKKSLTNFQRNQYRALFNSMALTDRKSMILVRINTTLLSVLIVFNQYVVDHVPMGAYIIVTALVGVGLSLILSMLSSKTPGFLIKRTLSNQILPKYPDLKDNMLITFSNPTLQDYEEAMDEIVRSQELQIGNQTRSSYLFNRILMRQYRMLDLSYNAFIITIIAVVLIFIAGFVHTNLIM
ncbi:hypothetical protein [Plebeiibacterium sediminum]|uniref:Pycsar effector protein domain-containing protein n=1 Tax=Plebeiibacterium sediminum TaxID=2992112 RepID=A0AAE3M220_9BACT|nr:hypothetical protein [Plebeiobacterium sediminum]MCW3785412.1 hypothetical protein [Plebeiobacterium sediminum]